ncbi:MAG: outer membrane beta-barrel protein [Bacteroidota bacterium]
MKKGLFITIAVFCLVSIKVQAQFSLGVKGGYTKAWEHYGDVDLPDDAVIHINRFNVSGLVYLSLNERLSIGVEPGYVERGAACIPGWNLEPDPIFNGDTKLFLSYVKAPIMLRTELPLGASKFSIIGSAGYGLSYLTTAFEEQELVGSDEPTQRTKVDLSEGSRLNRLDHGFYGSAAIGYDLGRGRLFAESEYYFGLRDADQFNTSKNRTLSFNVGYLFKI